MPISESGVFQIFSQLMWWEYQTNIVPRLVRDISFDVGTCLCNISAILNEYFTNIKQAVKLATYWNNMLHMSTQCYEYRFGYCTNAKTCFNVHFRSILAERRVLLGKLHIFKRIKGQHSISEQRQFGQIALTRFQFRFLSAQQSRAL